MSPVSVVIPVKTVSTLNQREHWARRSKRVASERAAVMRRMPAERPAALLEVRLTRCAPRKLDSGDNLSSSMKSIRDAVSTWLRIDDASPLVLWTYAQEKAPKGSESVRVEIGLPAFEAAPAKAPAPEGETALERMRRLATPNVR